MHLRGQPVRRARRHCKGLRRASPASARCTGKRRDLVGTLLRDGGFDAVRPAGAFYQMVPLAPGTDSRQAALDLVDHGVATAPGTAFGDVAADQLRLSLAASEEALRGGIDRLVAWAQSTAAGASLTAVDIVNADAVG